MAWDGRGGWVTRRMVGAVELGGMGGGRGRSVGERRCTWQGYECAAGSVGDACMLMQLAGIPIAWITRGSCG